MIRSWGHAHSLAIGALVGFGAASHAWVVVLAAFMVGLAVGVFWRRASDLARSAAAKVSELHAARVATEKARATELRTRTRHRAKPRRLQDAEVRRAYVQGATETARHLSAS